MIELWIVPAASTVCALIETSLRCMDHMIVERF